MSRFELTFMTSDFDALDIYYITYNLKIMCIDNSFTIDKRSREKA